MALAAWTLDTTFDETHHIEYARRIVDGKVPARSEGWYNSKTPALIPGVWAERLAIGAGVSHPKRLQTITRLTAALYFVALLFIVFFFTRRFAGPQAAWLAVLCCSLEPNLIAHAALNTVDVAFAAASLLALWAIAAFGRQAGWLTALGLGGALGLAFTVKFTGLFLVPLAASLPFWRKDGCWPTLREGLQRAGWLGLALLVSMLVISAAYGFHEFGTPLAEYPFVTAPFRLLASWLGWLPLPLPQPFLLGVDMVASHEREAQNVIIFDRSFEHGVWYYFVALWFFKTPIALMALALAGLWAGWRSHAFRQPGLTAVLFQWALYFAYFSFVFRGQLGYRYILMLVPMTFLLLAVGMNDWWTRSRGAYVAATVAVLSLAELIPYYGHTLAFSNSFLLPKKDAYRVLADSNLYWNEYETQLAGLLAARGARGVINPFHILPGTNAIDGFHLSVLWTYQHKWARDNLQTTGHVKHVVFLFDVSEQDFARFLDQTRRFAPSAHAADCTEPGRSSMLVVSSRNEGWAQLCASAPGLADVSFRAVAGRAWVGHVGDDGRCDIVLVRMGQEIWFRLEPGRHGLCVGTDGGPLTGSWEVRRGTAAFHETRPSGR
jgi:hypothetical protein